MPQIARLNLDLVARTANLQKGFKRAQGVVGKFKYAVRSSFAAAGLAVAGFATAVAAAATALWRFTKPAFKSVDAAAKLSDQIGLSVNELLAFQKQAELTGTSTEILNKGMLELVRRIGEAEQGYGEGARGLKMLGLSARELSQAGAAESMKRVSEAIRGLESPTQRAAAAYAVFGRQGRELVTFMMAGREGLDQTITDMQELGLTISRIDAANIEFANDQMTRMGAITDGVRQKLAAGFAPTIAAVIENVLHLGKEGGRSAESMATGFDKVNRILAKLINFGKGVAAVFSQVQQRIVQLTAKLMQDDVMAAQAKRGIEASAQQFNKAMKGEFGKEFLRDIEAQKQNIANAFEESGKAAAIGFKGGMGGDDWLSRLMRPKGISLAAFKGTKSVLDFLNKPRFGGTTAKAYTGSAALSRGSQSEFAAIAENRYFRKQGETAEKQLSVMEATKDILGDIKERGLALLPAGF